MTATFPADAGDADGGGAGDAAVAASIHTPKAERSRTAQSFIVLRTIRSKRGRKSPPLVRNSRVTLAMTRLLNRRAAKPFPRVQHSLLRPARTATSTGAAAGEAVAVAAARANSEVAEATTSRRRRSSMTMRTSATPSLPAL